MYMDSFDNGFVCTHMSSFYIPNVPIDFHHLNIFILGLMKVKEERQDLNELEEKHQCQKDHDVTGEKISELQHSNNRSPKAFQLLSVWKHLQT